MNPAGSSLAIIKSILEDTLMKKWQDPPIEIRGKAPHQYYEIRPYVPRPGSHGLKPQRKRIALGYCAETTMRKAQARKQEIMAPINAGKFILQAQIRFSELVEKYRDARLPKLGAATRSKYESYIANHILPVFGGSELADIDRQSIEAWLVNEGKPHSHELWAGSITGPDAESRTRGALRLEAKQYSGLGSAALQDARNILSAIFTAAADWGLWQGQNPCQGVKLGRVTERREKRIPSAADLQLFLAAIPETCILPADTCRLMVLTAVVSGLRVSEVLGLEPADIGPGTLTVKRRWHRGDMGPAKTAASNRIRQIGPLAEQLRTLGSGKHYIFEREPGGLPDDRDLQQHIFRPAAEAVGIYFEGFGMHTFRRLSISWRQEAGATPFEAMKAAGHAKPDMTFLYTITDQAREREHVQAILNRAMPAGGAVQ